MSKNYSIKAVISGIYTVYKLLLQTKSFARNSNKCEILPVN